MIFCPVFDLALGGEKRVAEGSEQETGHIFIIICPVSELAYYRHKSPGQEK
jgi:hypothetical protein